MHARPSRMPPPRHGALPERVCGYRVYFEASNAAIRLGLRFRPRTHRRSAIRIRRDVQRRALTRRRNLTQMDLRRDDFCFLERELSVLRLQEPKPQLGRQGRLTPEASSIDVGHAEAYPHSRRVLWALLSSSVISRGRRCVARSTPPLPVQTRSFFPPVASR